MTDNNSHIANNSSFPPSDWVETTLGEVCEIIDGDRGSNYPNGDDFSSDGYCLFLNTKNVPDYQFSFNEKMFITKEKDEILRKGKLQRGDFVLTTRGTVGNYAFYSDKVEFENIRLNSGMVILRTNQNKEFFNFYLKSPLFKHQIISLQSGTAQPQLPIKDLKTFEILLPPLPEQQAIALVLSAFDDKIELLREQNKTLEEMGQTIFNEWFGKYKVGDDLPEGWRVGKLGEEKFAEIIGSGINKFDREKIYLATADVSDLIITNTSKKITFQERPSRANMQPIEKSIWFAKMQDSRKLLMFDDYSKYELENFILSTGFAGIKTTDISHHFMWCFILTKEFNELKNNIANGAVQVAVNNTNLEKIEIVIPDEEILQKFNELTKPIFQKIYYNNSQIQSLARTRDELLPRLMRGEVRVS